jgi:integrase
MSIRKDKRGRFIVDCYPQGRAGKRVRLVLPGAIKSIATAKDIEQKILHPSNGAQAPKIATASTIKDLFPLYLEYCRYHIAEATHKNMKWTYERKFKNMLGLFVVAEIDKGHTTIYQHLRKADGVKNRTVNKEMTYFMMFLNWCRSEQKIPVKEFRYEKLPEQKPAHIILTPDEAIALILSAPLLHRVFFLCLYSLGIRFGEATSLTWEDLDETNKLIIVRNGKGGKSRILPVTDWLLQALDAIRPEEPRGLIFRSRRTGGPLVNVRKAIAAAAKKAGIRKHVNPHLLRHTLATHFMGMNINIKIIQKWLGHSQESTTAEMYTHDEFAHLRMAQDALSGHLDTLLTTEKLLTTEIKGKNAEN